MGHTNMAERNNRLNLHSNPSKKVVYDFSEKSLLAQKIMLRFNLQVFLLCSIWVF